jgi:hypothetical protein
VKEEEIVEDAGPAAASNEAPVALQADAKSEEPLATANGTALQAADGELKPKIQEGEPPSVSGTSFKLKIKLSQPQPAAPTPVEQQQQINNADNGGVNIENAAIE